MCVGSVRWCCAVAPHACAAGASAVMHGGHGLHTHVAHLQLMEFYLNCIAEVAEVRHCVRAFWSLFWFTALGILLPRGAVRGLSLSLSLVFFSGAVSPSHG
jgi:hypothetical protein